MSKFLNRVSSQLILAQLRQLWSQRGPNGPTGTLALLDVEQASSRGHVIAPMAHVKATRQKQLNVPGQTDQIVLKDRIQKKIILKLINLILEFFFEIDNRM